MQTSLKITLFTLNTTSWLFFLTAIASATFSLWRMWTSKPGTNVQVRKHALNTFVIHPLVHIDQKEKIAAKNRSCELAFTDLRRHNGSLYMSFSPNNLFKYKTFWSYNYLSKNIVPSQNTLRSDIEKRLKRNIKYCDKWTTDVHEIDIHIVRDFSAKSVANFLLTFTSFNRAAVVHEIFPPKI